MRRAHGLLALPLLALGCRRAGEPPRPVGATSQARVLPSPTVRPLLRPHALAAGLRLTLAPNLPGVPAEDVPALADRRVEVLSVDAKRLRLKWTGRVRLENAASARRREEWVRARAHGGPEVVAMPELSADYEEKEVAGTLEFPDFAHSRALVLPGLWPEGRATLRDTSAIWLAKDAREEIVRKGEARVPFAAASPLLADPAASLLSRAALLARSRSESDPEQPPPERLRVVGYPVDVPLRVDGVDGEVRVFRAVNWFGTFEVLADEANPLVLSFLPDPPSSTFLDLFAPAKILRTLLGYRVSAIDGPGAAN
jgi:hypothetical protein